MKDIEIVWRTLEEWRERTAGDVSVESLGAGWLCRLQAPRSGIAPALCHGVDATTAVEGALAMLAVRDTALQNAALRNAALQNAALRTETSPLGPSEPVRNAPPSDAPPSDAPPKDQSVSSRVTPRAREGARWQLHRAAKRC